MSQYYEPASNFLLHNYNAHFYGSQPVGQRAASQAAEQTRYAKQQFRPNTRSRTVPARAQQCLNLARKRTSRPIDEVQLDNTNYYRSYSGTTKRPATLYKKKQGSRPLSYQEMGGHMQHPAYRSHTQEYSAMPSTFPYLRPEYLPSYSTFPPTSMYPPSHIDTAWAMAKKAGEVGSSLRPDAQIVQEKYPMIARIAMKFAQLTIGTATIGLVLGPMRGNSYSDFVRQTSTEWQALVLGITISFDFCALFLLLTVFFANTSYCWRQTDAIISLFGTILYILATSLEIYYAVCYPPLGHRINLVCYRPEWILAAGFSFINLIVYAADLILVSRTGVSLL